MPLLEAFLALALTLLSLAMIATLIVEMIHRILRTRAKNLKVMLEGFYDTAIKPRLEAELQKNKEKLKEHRTKFIKKLMSNPLIKEGEKVGLLESWVKDVESLSPEDLFKKLAKTDIGQEIKKKTVAEIDEAVDSLSRSYDEFGVAATDLFKRKAQIVSLIAGVIVAFLLNVNALSVFKSFLNDPKARTQVVARTEAVLETFAKRTENLTAFTNKEEIAKDVNSIKEAIERLDRTGIPIGYRPDTLPRGRPENATFPRWLEVILWAVGVFITGLLIGLGGPFWFNVVRKLTDVLQALRGGTPAAAEAGGTATGPADPTKSNRDAFKTAGVSPAAPASPP